MPKWDSFREYPFWYYDEVTLNDGAAALPPQYILHQIKQGYNYLLNGFLISVPAYIDISIVDIAPTMYLEISQPQRGRNLFIERIPIDLFSSPGPKAPDGRDRPRTNFHPFNYLFSNKEAIVLRLTGQLGGEPEFIRIVTLGRNIRRERAA